MTKNKQEKSLENLPAIEQACDPWTTYDLGVSAALICAGFELVGIEKDNPQKCLFRFKNNTRIEGVANMYFSDKLEQKSRSFFDQLKALKNKLYS